MSIKAKRSSEDSNVIQINPFEKIPPQALEVEQALLGCLLLDPESIFKCLQVLKPSDFYRTAHQNIYKAILSLFDKGEPIDIVSVSEELKKNDQLSDCGGRSYINDLALAVATTESVDYYAKVIHEKAINRNVISLCLEVASDAYTLETPDVLSKAQSGLLSLVSQEITNNTVKINDVVVDVYELIGSRYDNKNQLLGTSWGFVDLDHYTSGLHASDLVIVGARPSMGKTAFALNIAHHVSATKKPVVFFSLEMSKLQLGQRLLCSEAEVPSDNIRTGEISTQDFTRISQTMGELSENPLFIDDTSAINLMELRSKAFKIKQDCGDLGLIVIDYLQLMSGQSAHRSGGFNREQEISTISRGLKAIARDLKVPVIALSQLSRAVEQRVDKKPILSDLRESGSLEQDADLVLFLYRDDYYNANSEKKGIASIIIAKQRNGPTGEIDLIFQNSITKFKNAYRSYF